MRYPKPDTFNMRLAADPRASQKVRIAVLKAIQKPTLAFLCRLLRDPQTPPRVKAIAASRYELEIAKKELHQNAKQGYATADHS